MPKIIALSLMVCGISALTLLSLVAPGLATSKKLENLAFRGLTLGALSSFVVLNLIGYWLAIQGISVRLTFQAVAIILVGFIGLSALRAKWKSFRVMLAFAVSVAIAGAYSLLPIISKLSSNNALGAYSSQNLDQISYIAIANEFIESGFQDSGHIAPGGINSFAQFGTPISPTILMTFIMSIFQISAWEAVLPTIIVAFGFATLGLVRLIEALFINLTKKTLTLISILIMSTSLISYCYINYFLGQILAIGLSAIILANSIENALGIGDSRHRFLELFLATTLAIFIYPVFLLPFLIYSSILGILVSTYNSKVYLKRYFLGQTLAIVLGLVTTIPYLFDAYKLVRYLLPITAGYPIPALNPLSMFAFIDQIGRVFEKNGLLLSWLVLSGVVVFLMFKGRSLYRDSFSASLVLSSSIIIVIFVPIFRGNSYSDYQSWKLISFFIPIILATVVPLFLPRKLGKVSHKTLGVITVLILFLGYTHNLKFEVSKTYPTKSMQEVLNSPLLRNVEELNVDLEPGWENMLMSIMLNDQKIYPVAQDLWQTKPETTACTLVRNTDDRYVIQVTINSDYGIAYGSNSRC